MFPVLFEIHDFRTLPGEIQLIEIVIGVAAALGWLALYLRGKRDWLASGLNLIAFLVAHVVTGRLRPVSMAALRPLEPARPLG